MARTIIHRECKKCGYSMTTSVSGYVKNPIGTPLIVCPSCNSVSRDPSHKEWVQLSPLMKLYAICPMAGLYGFLVGVVATAAASQKLEMLPLSESAIRWIHLGIFVAVTLLVAYVAIAIAVNRAPFLSRFIASVKRTRNPDYLKLISPFGKIYGENLPLFLAFSYDAYADIKYNLKKPASDEDIHISMMNGNLEDL